MPVLAALCVYLVILCGSVAVVQASANGREQALQDRFDARVSTAGHFIEAFVADTVAKETEIAHRELAGAVDADDFSQLSLTHDFAASVLLDSQGRLLALTPANEPLLGSRISQRYAHLTAAVQGTAAVSGVVPSVARAEPLVAFAVPFDTASGRRVFSAGFTVSDTPLSAYLANSVGLPDSLSYLVDGKGLVVAAGKHHRPADARLSDSDPAIAALVGLGDQDQTGFVTRAGAPHYVSAVPVEGTGWKLVFAVPTEVLYSPLGGSGAWVPWLSVLLFALLGPLCLFALARNLVQRQRLARSELRLHTILDTAPDAFVQIDHRGRVTDWNRAATELLGWRPEEVLGRPVTRTLVPDRFRADFEAALTATSGSAVPGLPALPFEVAAMHRSGEEVPVELVLSSLEWSGSTHVQGFLRNLRPRLAAESEQRMLAAMVSNSSDAIYARLLDGTIINWNTAAADLYGYTAEEAVNGGIHQIVPAERRTEYDEITARIVRGERLWHLETVRLRKDGSVIDVSLSGSPMVDPDGEVVGCVMSARDVTDARQQSEALRQTEELFRLAFDSVPLGMAMTSLVPEDRGRLMRVNPALCRLLGYSSAQLLAMTYMDITHPDDLDANDAFVRSILDGTGPAASFEKRYLHADGTPIWTAVTFGVLKDSLGVPIVTVTQIEDITERKAVRDRLTDLASRDPLTGLANRTSFGERLAAAVAGVRDQDDRLAILFCDLDGFKSVNDTHGHAVGDEVLREVAARLGSVVRPSDTVGRIGGDEFVLLCEKVGAGGGRALRTRVAGALAPPYLTSAGPLIVECSIGLAEGQGATFDPEELMERADLDMYADKRLRRISQSARRTRA